MKYVDGTFPAQSCAPMLTYLRVRCASVLALHPKLHSPTYFISAVIETRNN
jgi:hypothetical protein